MPLAGGKITSWSVSARLFRAADSSQDHRLVMWRGGQLSCVPITELVAACSVHSRREMASDPSSDGAE